MSGDDELDKLLFSVSNSSKKRKKPDSKGDSSVDERQEPAPTHDEAEQESGIDPLDVVALSDQQRKIVNWLSRHRRSSFSDIQKAVDIPPDELQRLLSELKAEKRISSAKRKGETLYSAPIHGQASRRLRGFPEDLWKKAGLDED